MSLILREPRDEDVPAICEIWNRDEVIWNTSRVPPIPESFAREHLFQPPPTRTIVALWDGKVVGQGNITPGAGRVHHKGTLSLMVHDAAWGQGVGSALMEAILDLADNWFGLSRMQLEVLASNARAIALYEKFGFETEGRLRGNILHKGKLADTIIMARLRPAPIRDGDAQ